MWIDSHGQFRERELYPHGMKCLHGAISSGFPLASHLALPGSESTLGLSCPSAVYVRTSQPRCILAKRAMGEV